MNGTRSTRAGQKGAPVSKENTRRQTVWKESTSDVQCPVSVGSETSEDLPADGDSAGRCHMSSYSET